jgi:ribosomal protein S18 acetylase RimI-like enzyme
LPPARPSLSSSAVPGPGVTIRAAESRDLDFLRALCRRVFLAYGSYDGYVAEWFAIASVSTFIGEHDGAAAGFSMTRIHPPGKTGERGGNVAELLAIAVVPELQTRGVGQALLDASLAVARGSVPSARKIRLSVADGNARAQRMFARNGFRFERASGIYPAGQRALFMVKTLRS